MLDFIHLLVMGVAETLELSSYKKCSHTFVKNCSIHTEPKYTFESSALLNLRSYVDYSVILFQSPQNPFCTTNWFGLSNKSIFLSMTLYLIMYLLLIQMIEHSILSLTTQ